MVDFKGFVHMYIFIGLYLVASSFDPNYWILIGGAIGSFLPDMDNKYAPAGIIPLWKIVRHREQTHSLFFALFCGILFMLFNRSLGIGITAGMILHYFFDLTTYWGSIDGLRYFWWPYKNHYRESQYKKI